MHLTSEEKHHLLALAREAISETAHNRRSTDVDLDTLPDVFREDGASFVTLTKSGHLRGCIGCLEAYRPLALDVQQNAISAAFHDPRFPPVTADEVDRLCVEISVLTPPEPLVYDGSDDLIAKLRPNIDGVVIQRGWQRATFLPQVWEKLHNPHEFLQHLCLKAGMPADAYRVPGLEVYTYQVDEFSEC